jgi:hypothetical protein
VGLTNLGSESETCVGSRVHLVGVSIFFEKNFYRLPFTPPLSGSPYRSFTILARDAGPQAFAWPPPYSFISLRLSHRSCISSPFSGIRCRHLSLNPSFFPPPPLARARTGARHAEGKPSRGGLCFPYSHLLPQS